MPELPEVETVKRGLEQILDFENSQVIRIECSDKKLRNQSAKASLDQACGQRIRGVRRKAKYLLFELDDWVLLSHLGMTGSWRIENDQRKHDHIRIFLSDGRVLTYHDARRFGMFNILPLTQWQQDPRIDLLGLDPVVDLDFNGEKLFRMTRKRETAIKAFIMNQTFIVGVGNIYASEALFMAGIHPNKRAGRLTGKQCELLATAIRDVLDMAIAAGGTTISDFRQAGGSAGYFQNQLLVYGRDREHCHFCGTGVRSQAIVGRNSFWCPKCQRM